MSDSSAGAAGGGAIYGLGIFGAWVYFWQQADSFWQYVLAFFQGSVLAGVHGVRGLCVPRRLSLKLRLPGDDPAIRAERRCGSST
jgi:hypothetical protein